MAVNRNWAEEDLWWRENFPTRSYAAGRTYEEFRPAYRYGFESGSHHLGRTWTDVEPDLEEGWERYEGKGMVTSAWDNIKDAVRDAWHRVTGQDDLDAKQMSESEVERLEHGGKPRK